MNKRIISLILCAVLLISFIPVSAHADEITFYQIRIDAGNGVKTEKAIIEDGEIYIPATSFGKYTRFEFDTDSQTFLIKGQEADKAFKKVLVNAETKKAAVGTKLIELRNSFVVDGVSYLPFCQMLPVLNADIAGVFSDVIYVTNNDLTMADLLYDFDINDYVFDINEEFYGNAWLAAGYIIPSYAFDSVIRKRFNRLDVIFNSGTKEDYEIILGDYLKDDELFHEAKKDQDAAGKLLENLTGLGDMGEYFYNAYDWIKSVAEMEISSDLKKYLEPSDLELLLKQGYTGDTFDDELGQILKAFYDGEVISDNQIYQDITAGGVSFVEGLQAVDYLYSVLNMVDDHKNMLDAVYSVADSDTKSTFFMSDVERGAAIRVYDLYSGDFTLSFSKRVLEEAFDRVVDGTILENFNVYSLTVGLAGEILELYIPGDSGDRGRLHLHANVITSARSKAAVADLTTEETTNDYRLSLLLALIASRKCYQTLVETPTIIEFDTTYYDNRVAKIEDMIKGLYLLADNVAFDTYENYEKFAQDNLDVVNESSILSTLDIYEPFSIIDCLGKDISFVVEKLGNAYIDEYMYGGHCYTYDDLGAVFFFEDMYGNGTTVNTILCVSDIDYGYGLSANMTFPEVVEVVSQYTTEDIGKPDGFYNMVDERYEYSLGVTINGITLGFAWEDDPETNKSYEMTAIMPSSSAGASTSSVMSEDDAYAIACEWWEYSNSDKEAGLSIISDGSVEKDNVQYYAYRLCWLVSNEDGTSNLSTLDRLYINAETGECGDNY